MNYCNLKFFNFTADYNDNIQNYYTVGYTYNINEGPLTISLQKDNISDDYDVFLYYKQEEYLNLNWVNLELMLLICLSFGIGLVVVTHYGLRLAYQSHYLLVMIISNYYYLEPMKWMIILQAPHLKKTCPLS